jgi:hypothetical protein
MFILLQKTFLSFFILKITMMETKTVYNQIVIKTDVYKEKQKLPINILIYLAAGALAGIALIFGLFAFIEILL